MSEAKKTGASPDPRTAEVLRALERARGMVASPDALLRPLAADGHSPQDVLETLATRVRFLETALATACEKLSDCQRTQDRAVQGLRESMQDLKHQADVLGGWYAWGGRRVTTWGAILALLAVGAVALSWRTYAVAISTHSVLEQILENQTRAQATKSGKRR